MKIIYNNIIKLFIFITIWYCTFSILCNDRLIIDLPQTVLINLISHKRLFLTSIALTICIFILYYIVTKSKIDNYRVIKILYNERVFIILLFCVGLILSVLIPIFQIPDEKTHIDMAFNELNQDIKVEDYANGFLDLHNRLPGHYNEKINLYNYLHSKDIYDPSFGLAFPSIGIIKHFPQIIGLLICSLFKMPTLATFTICEILALIFYCLICWISLRLLPNKKPLMMCIMALPICLQQMASFSYDSVLIPLCLFYFSYYLKLKFVKNTIKLSDLILLLGSLLVITLIKFPYILLGALLFTLPIKKLSLNLIKIKIDYKFINKHRILIIILSSTLILIVLVLLITFLLKGIYFKILTAAACNIFATVKLIFRSFITNIKFYINTIFGCFCNFDTPVSPIFVIFCIIGLALFTFYDFKKQKNNKINFKLWETILFLTVALFMIVMLILALFEWSIIKDILRQDPSASTDISNFSTEQISEYIYKIHDIEGVQGRYLVPVLPLLLLPWQSTSLTNKLRNTNYKFFTEIYYLLSWIYIINVIILRFWIS